GDEARRLGLTPANFTDTRFMRQETPDDFFNVVTLGRRRSGMPAWGDALSVQDRWDLVRYVWTLAAGDAAIERGRARLPGCPECTRALAAPATVAKTSDAALLDTLAGGEASDRLAPLDDGSRWGLVAAVRADAFDRLVGDPTAAPAPTAAENPREA